MAPVTQLLLGAALVVGLILVIVRLLRVGCKLVVFGFYFVLLIIAAALLYALLERTRVLDALGQ